MLLYELYDNDERLAKVNAAQLCYVVGLFFYTSCTILIFALWGYIRANENSFLKNLWIIHDVFNIFMYTLFTVGFVIEVQRARYLRIKNNHSVAA